MWKFSAGVLCGFALGQGSCFWRGQEFQDPRGAEEGVCREESPSPCCCGRVWGRGSLTAAASGAALSQQIVVPPVLEFLVALEGCSALNAGSLSTLILLSS